MNVIKPPQKLPTQPGFSIFLAGSIEMGKAIDWQTKVAKSLEEVPGYIFNPRRDDWDSSWVQSIENKQFKEQVEWELSALERSNLILMYFDPKTQSPISLLELGLFARSQKMVVCCPKGFWRKGNVDIVCERYKVKQVENLEALIEAVEDF